MEVWLTPLITGILSFIGGLLLGRQSEKREERQRKAARTQEYTDKAVKALSKVKLVMGELQPTSLLAETEPGQSWKRVSEAINRYQDAREPLTEVAFGHPSKTVRDAVSDVDDRAFKVMKATSLFVVSFSPGYRESMSVNLPTYAEDAKQAFDTFQASIDEALARLHSEEDVK